MSIEAARTGYSADVEENRYLMEERLSDVANRAREAGSIGDELKTLKVLAMVQGLTKTAPESTLSELVKVIDAVVAETDAPRIEVTE